MHTTLWDLKNEAEMGHIELSREADLVVVCPATADLMAKMAAGIADDMATTLILATDKPVMAVPAMNVRMWEHEATQRNVKWLRQAGVQVMDPDEGPMACGEFGYGRLPEPEFICAEIAKHFGIEVEVPVAKAAEPVAEPDEAEVEEEVEAIEPEPAPKGGGLGGLLSSIIPRSTAKRSAEEIEAEYLEAEEAAAAAAEESEEVDAEAEGEDVADAPVEDDVDPDAVPDLDGPLMAQKGAAKSAPPTDAEAINHEVSDNKDAPEPVPGEVGEEEEAEPVKPEEVEAREEDALGGETFKVKKGHQPLKDRHIVITAGPTWESIDPVRYIANRSSGKQGFAIAAAAAALGAKVTLVAGPVALKTPKGVERVNVESARDMAEVVREAMPADAAVMVAAVADWRPKEYRAEKMKKRGSAPPALVLEENPDILTNISASDDRPKLVVGFAAETEDVLENAKSKRKRKTCDWIVANDVSGDVMGGDTNKVHIVDGEGVESLEEMPKLEVAMALVERIAAALNAEDES